MKPITILDAVIKQLTEHPETWCKGTERMLTSKGTQLCTYAWLMELSPRETWLTGENDAVYEAMVRSCKDRGFTSVAAFNDSPNVDMPDILKMLADARRYLM